MYVFLSWSEHRKEYQEMFELIAESDDKQVLLTMLELTKEKE